MVNFWLDVWCGNEPLKDTFPNLYNIAQNKQAKVADYLSWHNDEKVWSVIFFEKFTGLGGGGVHYFYGYSLYP